MGALGTNFDTKCIIFFWGVIFPLALSNLVASQAIVNTLPGFPGELPFLLETGYIGVGEEEELQLFYYFIESEAEAANEPNVPLLLWLGGGPGCSALSDLMYGIGPLAFDYESSKEQGKPVLALNDFSWTKVANIIFLDAPVGTGFSYATTSEGYNTSDTKTIDNIYEFLRKWLLSHPDYHTDLVYISGNAYSGIIVPPLVEQIYYGNAAGVKPGINLRGYVLGNPFTDSQYDYNSRVKFAHRMALLSDELYEAAKLDCKGQYANPNRNSSACIQCIQTINYCLHDIYKPMILEPSCYKTSSDPNTLHWDLYPIGGSSFSDALFSEADPIGPWCRDYDYLFIDIWANDRAVQEALHVRDGTIIEWERCNRNLSYEHDIQTSLAYHRNLTSKNIRGLVYSGDHDLLIPHVGTEEWIESLSLTASGADDWRPWYIDGQIAGYTVLYSEGFYTLTYATVKGAGHNAPEYRPRESFDMISRWLAFYYL